MADNPIPAASKAKKDRSPSFPFIPLQTAVERLETFDKHFGRHPTPANRVGAAWGMKDQSSQADQTLAALRSFGFVTYDGSGPKRTVSVSADGRVYLRAQQDTLKAAALKQAALRPKIIRKFWALWGADRPVDAVALDTLVLDNAFSDNGARAFLKVYDDTVAYAKLSMADKVSAEDGESSDEESEENGGNPSDPPPPPPPPGGKVKIMEGERVAFTEEMRPGQYLKVIASGDVDDFLLDALGDFVARQRKLRAILKQPAGLAKKPEGVFDPGEIAPVSGNYIQTHPNGHREDHTITLEKGAKFPPCSVCGNDSSYRQMQIGEKV